MALYTITYDSEYGEGYYESDENENYRTFIRKANKYGRLSGLLHEEESVLDCDYELSKY